MKLSIIIVSFNTRNLLKNCLTSIYQNTSTDFLKNTQIIVVDNNSHDGSVGMLTKEFPEVITIKNKANLGFARANNIGAKWGKGDFILFLNSDTVIKKETLAKSLSFLESHEDIAVLGCRLVNIDGSLQYSAGFLPSILNISLWMKFIDDIPVLNRFLDPYHIEYREFYDNSQKAGWVSGAFFLIRKNALDKVGLFDENLFMYGEEVELCLRVSKNGWKVFYYNEVEITHLKGASGEGNISGLLEEFKALIYIWQKHYPSWQLPLLRLTLKFGALLRHILFGIILADKKKKDIYAKAFKVA